MQQLRALVELSRLGTVSAAADSLGFSQSTVSHQLAALSRATGAVLLTRAGRGVRLTEEGRALAARGQEVLDLLERTEREVVSMACAEAGRVRLAAFPSAVASLVPGVLDVVGRQYPGLEVELVDAEPPEALDALRRGRVDAALSFSYIDDDAGEGLQAELDGGRGQVVGLVGPVEEGVDRVGVELGITVSSGHDYWWRLER